MSVPDDLRRAVQELVGAIGVEFAITDEVVTGTELHIVYATEHPLPPRYNQPAATFGFRVPRNFPDAGPEDSFFLRTAVPLKLMEADPIRHSADVNRASVSADFAKGTSLEGGQILVFSWHLWNKSAWNRRKHTLLDHYAHCVRRFEQPEHD